jgi:hypothetical protein
MNISKFPALCLLATAFAFAQFPWEEQPAPETLAPPPSNPVSSVTVPSSSSAVPPEIAVFAPQPAPSSSSAAVVEIKPAAPEGKTIFDSVRGHAYNPYEIVGAALTVADLVKTPSDIYQQRFIYISPSDFLGYTAFNLGGSYGMIGLDKSSTDYGDLAALIFGYANSGFGMAFNISIGKMMSSNSDTDTDVRATFPGDDLGFYLSIPIGSSTTLYANIDWLTYRRSTNETRNNRSESNNYTTISASAGVTGSAGLFNYDAFLELMRTGGTKTDNDGEKYVDEDTESGISLNFNFSITALQSETARAIIGFNNGLGVEIFDAISGEPPTPSDNIVLSVISPNILGEVALFENLLAFAGARHNLIFVFGDGDRRDATSLVALVQSGNLEAEEFSGTQAFAGLRYQRNNWALEAIVSTHPFEIMNGENIFAKFGGFAYF